MSTTTSNELLDNLLAADLGKRHFSKWTAKEQEEAIRRCGLSSAQFNNKSERIKILEHLHATALPIDRLPVLRLIADFGLPPSGARSTQQFAYYLLCYMCEALSFPPWDPQPVIKIISPGVEELVKSARNLCAERVLPAEADPPHFYRESADLGQLWLTRRSMWDRFLESGVQQFLTELAGEYVKVTNLVLAHSPKCKPCDLRCEIDTAQFRVDRVKVPALFLKAWNLVNSAVVKFDLREWRWGLGHLLASTKRAVAQAVRVSYSDGDVDEEVYVGDTVCLVSIARVFVCVANLSSCSP